MSSNQLKFPFAEEAESVDDLVNHEPIHVDHSTFKAGLAARVHRWFRLQDQGVERQPFHNGRIPNR